VGAAADARQARRPRGGRAAASIGLSSRLLFQIAVGIVLAATLVFLVIRPAVDRGGAGELLVIAAIFAAILLIERWLRTR
jgi:hypothetical protein